MDEVSLDSGMAAEFLRKLGKHLDYNINIMNRAGIIIASRDGARVGTFHEVALRLVETGAEIDLAESSASLPSGVRPGVNLPIEFRGRTIGVVGVTGEPSSVLPVAYAIKTSVESMVELKLYRDESLLRLDKKNLFIRSLLYEADVSRPVLEDLAQKLGYDPRLPRAPILFSFAAEVSPSEALSAVKTSAGHRGADISWATPEGAVLVFKTIEFTSAGILSDYQSCVERYAESVREACRRGSFVGEPFRAYAGIFQTDLTRYRSAYRQAVWLQSIRPESDGRVSFFSRRLGDIVAFRLPRPELAAAFDPILDSLSSEYAAEFRSSIDALSESSFNVSEAAARLGIHRNTLASRLSRLESIFGGDPRIDARLREYIVFFARYLELQSLPGTR